MCDNESIQKPDAFIARFENDFLKCLTEIQNLRSQVVVLKDKLIETEIHYTKLMTDNENPTQYATNQLEDVTIESKEFRHAEDQTRDMHYQLIQQCYEQYKLKMNSAMTKIMELTEENKQLQNEIQEKPKIDLTETKNAISTLNGLMLKLQIDYEALLKMSNAAEKNISKSALILQQLKERLDASTLENKEMRRKNIQLQMKLMEIESKRGCDANAGENAEMELMQQEINSLKDELDRTRSENIALKSDLVAMKEVPNDLTNQIDKLFNKVNSLESNDPTENCNIM